MDSLLKSRSLISIFVLGSGNVLGTVISAITLIIFSRVLGPTEFGLFSASFALMQIMVKLIDSGTTSATERTLSRSHSRSPQTVSGIMSTAMYLKLALYLTWAVLGYLASDYLATKYLGLSSSHLVRTAIVLSLGTVIFEYATVIFQSAGQFALVSRITVAQALGKLLGGLLLFSQSALNATSALWLYALMPALGTIAGWVKSPLKLSYRLPNTWRHHTATIIQVAKWTGFATLAATFADNLDTLIVQSMLSLHDTGVWSAAARIAAFANLLPWTIGSVLSVRVTQFHAQKHVDAYLKKSHLISLASCCLILLVIPFSRLALSLTVGPAYLDGTQPLMFSLLAAGFTAATAPYSALYYLFERPQYYAYAGILSTVLLIVLDYLLIPQFGINGAGYARAITRFAVLLFTLGYTHSALAHHRKSHP